MTELAWRQLRSGVAVCCTILGGPDTILHAGNERYIQNHNNHLDYAGSLYPVRLLENYLPPARVPVFDGHLNERWTNQHRPHLGWCRHIHWHRPTSSLRGWIYPFKSAVVRLLECELSDLNVISGSYMLDGFTTVTTPGQRWKLANKFDLVSVDLVPESTAGGRLLTQRDLNYKIVRIRHDQNRIVQGPG